jgi:hypothetical protein
MQPGIFGFVNYTHPAAAQLVDNAVMRNGLTDHDFANPGWRKKDEAAMLGKAEEQVNAEPGIAIEGGKIQPPLGRMSTS